MKSSIGEKEFFSVFPIASEGKTDEVKEFTIAERTVKVCLLHFRLEYLRKCYSVNDLFMNNRNPVEPFEGAVTQYSLCKHTILTSGRLI